MGIHAWEGQAHASPSEDGTLDGIQVCLFGVCLIRFVVGYISVCQGCTHNVWRRFCLVKSRRVNVNGVVWAREYMDWKHGTRLETKPIVLLHIINDDHAITKGVAYIFISTKHIHCLVPAQKCMGEWVLSNKGSPFGTCGMYITLGGFHWEP